LCAKGKEKTTKGPRSANRTAKITTFIIMIQIKRKLFLLFCKAVLRRCNMSKLNAVRLLESGCKSKALGDKRQI
ncbi:hypothetical protein ACIXFJ_21680, partial [Bacteroides fragilis]